MKPTRESIIKDIADAVLKNRQATYGPPENSFTTIAGLWGHYLEARLIRRPDGATEVQPLTPHDVAAMMLLLKVARIAINPAHADNWIDAGGYAVCGGELAPLPEQGVGLQACNNDLQRPVTEIEAQEISRLAHKMAGVTVKVWGPQDDLFITEAMLRPTSMDYSAYLHMKWLSSL